MKAQFYSLIETKHFLLPSACSAAIFFPGSQHCSLGADSPGDIFISEHRCSPLCPLGQQALEQLHVPPGTVFVGRDGYLWSECRSQLGSAKCPDQARSTAAFLL